MGHKNRRKLIKKGTHSNLKNKLTLHTLRHSFTIYLLNKAKIPLNEVQQLLGHGSIFTTRIYTKLIMKSYKMDMEKYIGNNILEFY